MGDNEFASGFLAGQGGGNNNGLDNGWGGIFGIIALLALANGGFGGFGGGAAAAGLDTYSNALQTSILENSANQRQNCTEFANTNSNIVNGNYQTQNMVNNGFNQMQRDLGTAANTLAAITNNNANDIRDRLWNMQTTNQECCCNILRAIDGVNYNIQQQADRAERLQQQQKIEYLQNQVNQLNLSAQLCGVVRYPNSITYNAGQSPFFNNCNCSPCC